MNSVAYTCGRKHGKVDQIVLCSGIQKLCLFFVKGLNVVEKCYLNWNVFHDDLYCGVNYSNAK